MKGILFIVPGLTLSLLQAVQAKGTEIVVRAFTDRAVQEAVEKAVANDVVILPSGQYLFEKTVVIKRGITLRGAANLRDVGGVEPGPENVPPYWDGEPSLCLTQDPELTLFQVESDDVKFVGLKMEGAVTHETGTGYGIVIFQHNGLLVEGCELLHHRKGVFFRNSLRGRVQNSYLHENYHSDEGYGVDVHGKWMDEGGSEAVISGCEFSLNRHDIASNSPQSHLLVEGNYFHDDDPVRKQASVDAHPQGGASYRLVVRNNVFENTRPIDVKTGSVEITGNRFDRLCGEWWPHSPIYLGPPEHNGKMISQARLHDIYIGGNVNETGHPPVHVRTFGYADGNKWVAYNVYVEGELHSAAHPEHPPVASDPRPLIGHIYVTAPDEHSPLTTIRRNTWYDLHAMACDPEGASDIAQINIRIVDGEQVARVSGNEERPFDPRSGYFLRSEGNSVFVREDRQSDRWTDRSGSRGEYVNARPEEGKHTREPHGGHRLRLILRFRLLPEARVGGGWRLYGYAVDRAGNTPIPAWYDQQEGWPLIVE
jgi:hypothetical protein